MAEFPDLEFIHNDYSYRKSPCFCGCPPSKNEDILPEDDSDKLIQEEIKNLTDLAFFKKPFNEHTAQELEKIHDEIMEYIHFYPKCGHSERKAIRDNCRQIEKTFQTVIMTPNLITIADFLTFMEWTPDKNPREFYICLETVLDNRVYRNGRNWRDQTILLEQVRVFFDVFNADVNHEFILRHDGDDDNEGQIYFWKYPLHLALTRNMPKSVCEYLLSLGADPELKNQCCSNAFYECLDNRHAEVYDLFTPQMRRKLVTVNPFVWACSPTNPSIIPIFEKLLQLGFDINCPHKYPPLINLFACSRGHVFTEYRKFIIIKWMIETAKADPNVSCSEGRTLLHYICRSPYGWYCHPLVRQYILDSPLFSWNRRDKQGVNPCEYLLDYHLEDYPDPEEAFPGCKLPNFLCQVILATGLRNITDAALWPGMACGQRLRLAKVILFLKYQSLMQNVNDHTRELLGRIRAQWHIYYCTSGLVEQFPNTIQLQQTIYAIARHDVEVTLANDAYRKLVRKIIMTDLIIGDAEINRTTTNNNIDNDYDYFNDDYDD